MSSMPELTTIATAVTETRDRVVACSETALGEGVFNVALVAANNEPLAVQVANSPLQVHCQEPLSVTTSASLPVHLTDNPSVIVTNLDVNIAKVGGVTTDSILNVSPCVHFGKSGNTNHPDYRHVNANHPLPAMMVQPSLTANKPDDAQIWYSMEPHPGDACVALYDHARIPTGDAFGNVDRLNVN